MADADFSHLQSLAITNETTAEYVFHDIPGQPSVILAPAHDSNEAFMNERLRRQIERNAKMAKEARSRQDVQAQPTREQLISEQKKKIEEDRESDRHLLAKACARGWGRAPTDIHGNQPEFTVQNCYAFFKALPIHMFDPLRNFAVNLYNFMPEAVTEDEAEALGN